MPQPILVQAEGESAHLLRELIGKLPAAFEAAEEVYPTRGLNVEPVTVALIAATGQFRILVFHPYWEGAGGQQIR